MKEKIVIQGMKRISLLIIGAGIIAGMGNGCFPIAVAAHQWQKHGREMDAKNEEIYRQQQEIERLNRNN